MILNEDLVVFLQSFDKKNGHYDGIGKSQNYG